MLTNARHVRAFAEGRTEREFLSGTFFSTPCCTLCD
jgi:hypothetical protein